MGRKPAPKNPKLRRLIAYDLETTPIREGSPDPRYLSAFGEGFQLSIRVGSVRQLAVVLANSMLTRENVGARFCAWNGNNFDGYIIAAALLHMPGYTLRPYFTRTKNMRGLRVEWTAPGVPDTWTPSDALEWKRSGKKRIVWEFLDGWAMAVGSIPMKLDKFLSLFAPGYRKLAAPDWEHEEFDADNAQHVLYAERDSEGLYHAMQRAEAIVLEHFGFPFGPTIGNTGIKIFQAHIPENVVVWDAPREAASAIRDYVNRGGYCVCMKRYRGPVWKYDLNQAYAAAMRDAELPAGRCFHIASEEDANGSPAIYRVRGSHPSNVTPFYYRPAPAKAALAELEITDTWLTSIELAQLRAEQWDLEVLDGWAWEDAFSMREYVERFERLRMSDPAGPNGPLGTMCKYLVCASYGKTAERLEGTEIVLANECPEGFYNYFPENEEEHLQTVWFRFAEPMHKPYHKPQIASFITAHVRMIVRRAALLAGETFLYADTDCLVASAPVDVPIDPRRYGYWKAEVAGEEYLIINKKTYAQANWEEGAEPVRHAKGLNVRRLTREDFVRWHEGESPEQEQLQRGSLIRVLTGEHMFVRRVKVGERR